jgi:hypothetical protein
MIGSYGFLQTQSKKHHDPAHRTQGHGLLVVHQSYDDSVVTLAILIRRSD